MLKEQKRGYQGILAGSLAQNAWAMSADNGAERRKDLACARLQVFGFAVRLLDELKTTGAHKGNIDELRSAINASLEQIREDGSAACKKHGAVALAFIQQAAKFANVTVYSMVNDLVKASAVK